MTITFTAPIKRHYSLKEVQQMANELTEPRSTNISEFLRKESTGASFGNIDASDLKPPQLKVLAGQSPEVTDGVPGALPGNFWITILNQNLGPSVVGSPILLRKTYQVWAPKAPGSDQKGPLAVASDGINWDVPDQSFDIKFPGNPRTYVWKLGRTVSETGAHKFGSSQDDDKSSKPIATLTYDVLWLIDLSQRAEATVRVQVGAHGRQANPDFHLDDQGDGNRSVLSTLPHRCAEKDGSDGRSLLRLRLPVRRRGRERSRSQGSARTVRQLCQVWVCNRHR